MSEQTTCHEWDDGPCAWWLRDRSTYIGDGFCVTCGCALHSNGTTTRMVPEVTSDAVRETDLWQCLSGLTDADTEAALWTLGLLSDDRGPTTQGRTILAALQQAPVPEPAMDGETAIYGPDGIGLATAPGATNVVLPQGQQCSGCAALERESAEAKRRLEETDGL